jgi:V/A-type H+-transporting ATPase subunit I
MIRPRPARWFEALVARDDCTLLLEALAATGAVELEARAGAKLPEAFASLGPALARVVDFQARYGAWWPVTGITATHFPEPPARTLERGLARLDAWAREAEGTIRKLERNRTGLEETLLWRNLVDAQENANLDLGALSRAGPLTQARLLEFAPGLRPALPDTLLAREFEISGHPFVIVLGSDPDIDAACRETMAAKGRCHRVPGWLGEERRRNIAAIGARLAEFKAEQAGLEDLLNATHQRHGLHNVLGDLRRLQWVVDHVDALESGDRLAWVTGWTSDRENTALAGAIERSGARALLHLAAAPGDTRAPLLFSNPRWARPFELFPRALGVPGATEADPTVLLAVAVPLIFGYMFGDVGEGLTIAAAGIWLRKRLPVARLLIGGGLCAAFFGWVFGCIFTRHDLIAPLWTDPLAAPIAILSVPVAAGAALLAAGLALNALGSFWRGEWARLLGEDLGLIIVYAGILGMFFSRNFQWLALCGTAAFVTGHALHAGRIAAFAAGLGLLVERTLQLGINTLSFARVGAFALAHAGLASAVSALALQADGGIAGALVIVLGNVLIIVLETLVVSIQTTRLVLFEFFARFLRGTGRPFRPLAPPPSLVQET